VRRIRPPRVVKESVGGRVRASHTQHRVRYTLGGATRDSDDAQGACTAVGDQADQPRGGLVSDKACPICGDPHPLFVKDESELEKEPSAYPECEHWIGRYDTDDGCHWDRDTYVEQVNLGLIDPYDDGGTYSGSLAFLDEVHLPPLVEDDEEWPERNALEAVFGDRCSLAEAAYDEWESPGDPGAIFDAVLETLGIRSLEISGGTGPMDSWISYEYYVQDPNATLDRLRREVSAVVDGVRAFRGPEPADGAETARDAGALLAPDLDAACPFCGDPHPSTQRAAADADPVPTPGCEHWIGRYDSYRRRSHRGVGAGKGFSGRLHFLNELDLPPLVESLDAWPEDAALESAFGNSLKAAEDAYEGGWASPGDLFQLLTALEEMLGIESIMEIRSRKDSTLTWLLADYYAQDPAQALARVRSEVKAVADGLRTITG
jgi:hypothetical protein